MSSSTIVAKRYAKALFEVAHGREQLLPVEEGLELVVSVIGDNDELKSFLQHPNVEEQAKLNVVAKLFEEKVPELVLNTVQLMIKRQRGDLFPALLDYYVNIANEALGQATAVVYTPEAISEEQAAEIASKFGEISGKKIRVKNEVNPDLLGGMQVKIGDRLYDGSLSSKLNTLERQLKQSQAM